MPVFPVQVRFVVGSVGSVVVVAYVVVSAVVSAAASEVVVAAAAAAAVAAVEGEEVMRRGQVAISRARISMRTTQGRINLVVMVVSVWIAMVVAMVEVMVTSSLSQASKSWFGM